MRIAPEHIEMKQLAGKTKDGEPIVYVVTKGGLHSLFTKKDGSIVTLGAAPHKAVAIWLAEKKSPDIEWESHFKDSEMKKSQSEAEMYNRLRTLMFRDDVLAKSESSDVYLVYNIPEREILVMHKEEVQDNISFWRQLPGVDNLMIRPIDLSEPVQFVRYHKFYKDFNG